MSKVPEPVAEAAPPAKAGRPKKKKLMVLLLALVVLLAVAGGGAWWFMKHRAAQAEDDEDAPVAEAVVEHHDEHPPTFLPLENMVVNLADPTGERFAQIGITLEVADSKASDQVKAYMPSIRSGILLLLSQRTAAELLQREGKEKLAQDILVEASRPFSMGAKAKPAKTGKAGKKAAAEPAGPVRGVLFSSFIIQ